MFSGQLVAIDRTGPINQSNLCGLKPVEVTFCMFAHKMLKVIIDYSPSDEGVNQWRSLELDSWELDYIAHIKKDEYRVEANTIDFVVDILHARSVVREDGKTMIEQKLKPYLLQLDNKAEGNCLRYTLQHYEDLKLLHRLEHEEYKGRRGI